MNYQCRELAFRMVMAMKATALSSNMTGSGVPVSSKEPTEEDADDDDQDPTETYKGFGSFHSDNVQDLVSIPESSYRPPQAAVSRFSGDDELTQRVDRQGRPLSWVEALGVFGAPIRRSHYLLDDTWTFVNHGAFGGALAPAIRVKRQYEDMMEAQPLAFVDRMLLPLLVFSTRSLANFIGARPEDVALVSNATFGLNAAINATLRHEHDLVGYLDTEYGSVWKMMRERCSIVGCSGHEIPLSKHFADPKVIGSDEAITAYIESQVPPNCTVFLLDHVASTSAICLPIFSHIIPMLRRKGVKHIVVDGAHGPLQYPLNFQELREDQLPTAYIGNLHKWVSCPKSVGFIWTRPDMQKRMHSPVVSHGSRAGYLSEFIWDGTKDYGAYLTIPAVLNFWTHTVGVVNARQYCTDLMVEAEKILCAGWGTNPVPRGSPFMKLVRLPSALQAPAEYSTKFIQDILHAAFRVEVPVKTVDGIHYVRVSAFINNSVEDYERLRDAVLKLVLTLRKRYRHPISDPPLDDIEKQEHPQQPNGTRVDCGGCGVLSGGVRPAAFSDSDSESAA